MFKKNNRYLRMDYTFEGLRNFSLVVSSNTQNLIGQLKFDQGFDRFCFIFGTFLKIIIQFLAPTVNLDD